MKNAVFLLWSQKSCSTPSYFGPKSHALFNQHIRKATCWCVSPQPPYIENNQYCWLTSAQLFPFHFNHRKRINISQHFTLLLFHCWLKMYHMKIDLDDNYIKNISLSVFAPMVHLAGGLSTNSFTKLQFWILWGQFIILSIAPVSQLIFKTC